MYKVEKIVMGNDDAHVLKTRAVYKRMRSKEDFDFELCFRI